MSFLLNLAREAQLGFIRMNLGSLGTSIIIQKSKTLTVRFLRRPSSVPFQPSKAEPAEPPTSKSTESSPVPAQRRGSPAPAPRPKPKPRRAQTSDNLKPEEVVGQTGMTGEPSGRRGSMGEMDKPGKRDSSGGWMCTEAGR